MGDLSQLKKFTARQLLTVSQAAARAEELVSDYYKLSASGWLRSRYDVRTLKDLSPDQIIFGHFAQTLRYVKDSHLKSSAFEIYQICLQDHTILSALKNCRMPDYRGLKLKPLLVYIVTHELIHVVRFGNFEQLLEASEYEKDREERRVHQISYEILSKQKIGDIKPVFDFYEKWRSWDGSQPVG